jgi:outer membrane protein assembly factor BamB
MDLMDDPDVRRIRPSIWRRRPRSKTPAIVLLVTMLVIAISCSPSTTPTPSRSASRTSPTGNASPSSDIQWVTYHADGMRSGVAVEASLAGVEQTWVSPQLDGDVYAEPLVFDGDVVAATENNSVYALDASSGDVRWQTNLGAPVDSSTLPCGNIHPISGITATPVIDPSSNLIYAVAFLAPGHHELFAIHAESGEVAWHRPIDPPGMDPLTQQLRSALALANGRVYAAFGGLFGDCGQYHGWVAGLAADGSGSLIDYRAPTVNAGGIWAPSGPAVDEDGNLYVATGNSFSNTEFDLGDSVIKLSPTLEQLDFFAPTDWADLNAGDVDLGSVGPAVLPDGRIFQIGKGGTGYLLDGAHLGGIGGELSSAVVCGSSFGGTAHTADSIYVPCTDGLVALSLSEDGGFAVRWRSATFDAGPPIVAGGLVWTVDVSAAALVGFDQASGDEVVRRELADVSHFASPSYALGCLFAPTLRTITALC